MLASVCTSSEARGSLFLIICQLVRRLVPMSKASNAKRAQTRKERRDAKRAQELRAQRDRLKISAKGRRFQFSLAKFHV
jgi:hypothetical protein